MRIAQLSNLFESVPPKLYGGIERVVYELTEGLVERGHDVTLFATGDSKTRAKLVAKAPKPMRELGITFPEMYALLTVRELIQQSHQFDIIHSHMSEWGVAFDGIFHAPLVTTLHGQLGVPEFQEVYRATNGTPLISISNSQRKLLPDLHYIATIYNGIQVDKFPFSELPGEYLAFFGRIAEEKGTHLAIEVAKKLKERLIIASKVDPLDQKYFEEEIRPHVDGKQVEFIGELDDVQKGEFLKRAKALIAPIQWEEPFGLYLIESMATGTPVVAFERGSVPEVVKDKQTGFIVHSVHEAVDAVKNIHSIRRRACRDWVQEKFSVSRMIGEYEDAYRKIIKEYAKSRH